MTHNYFLESEFNLQQLCLELDLGGEELLRLTKNSTLSQCINLQTLLFQFYDTISSGFLLNQPQIQ